MKSFTTKVKSLAKIKGGFEVTFEDTILFPEGGGQPCDFGNILKDNKAFQVTNVTRKGAEAIHFIQYVDDQIPFSVGDEIEQQVDWERRSDHMQQHSGQHLITAVFEREYNITTKSWWLGVEASYIEVETNDVSPEQMMRVEKLANEMIARAVPVTITLHDASDPIMDSVRSAKDVPEDVVGPLRVCNIQGIDRNLCCGTHVNNLAQLQVVKLLHVEKSKNKTLVHFLVGNRVIQRLGKCIEREQQMNLLLNGGPEAHLELIKKLQNSTKTNQKLLKTLSKELAAFEVIKFNESKEKRYYIIHRHDGLEGDFVSTFLRSVNAPDTLFFITCGDEKQGSILLQGPAKAVETLGPQICELLDGKGNGKGTRFQGKANNFKKSSECDKLIHKFFEC